MINIIVADENTGLAERNINSFTAAGIRIHSVIRAKELQNAADEIKPALILMDFLDSENTGIELCRKIKSSSQKNSFLIVFISDKNDESTQLDAYAAGADDFLAKSVKTGVLLSRIKAHLKSRMLPAEEKIMQHGRIRIDPEKFQVILDERIIHLPRKEFELLCLLASRPDRVFTRDEIISAIWKDEKMADSRTLDVHIRKIREKTDLHIIKTLKGVGYKFNSGIFKI